MRDRHLWVFVSYFLFIQLSCNCQWNSLMIFMKTFILFVWHSILLNWCSWKLNLWTEEPGNKIVQSLKSGFQGKSVFWTQEAYKDCYTYTNKHLILSFWSLNISKYRFIVVFGDLMFEEGSWVEMFEVGGGVEAYFLFNCMKNWA